MKRCHAHDPLIYLFRTKDMTVPDHRAGGSGETSHRKLTRPGTHHRHPLCEIEQYASFYRTFPLLSSDFTNIQDCIHKSSPHLSDTSKQRPECTGAAIVRSPVAHTCIVSSDRSVSNDGTLRMISCISVRHVHISASLCRVSFISKKSHEPARKGPHRLGMHGYMPSYTRTFCSCVSYTFVFFRSRSCSS